jgi:biopolymer transport protein ExbD
MPEPVSNSSCNTPGAIKHPESMIVPSPRSQRRARIEIVPLIDVIFFLLATFVMVSLSMIQNKGITVNLPVASSTVPQKQGNPVTISLTNTGEIYFNKEKVDPEILRQNLNRLKAHENDPKVFIHGDAKVNLGDFTAVIDSIRKAGITKIAIQTKSGTAATP